MILDTIFGCLEPYENQENADRGGKVRDFFHKHRHLFNALSKFSLTLTQLLMLGFLYSICDASKTNNRNYVEGDFEFYEDDVDSNNIQDIAYIEVQIANPYSAGRQFADGLVNGQRTDQLPARKKYHGTEYKIY
jgi:hypothetical protein